MVASKARRSSAALLAGRPGGAANGRTMAEGPVMSLKRGEHEHVDLLVAQPVRLGDLERGVTEHAAPMHLAAFDCQDRFLAADIAGYQFELGAEHVVENE